MTFWGYQRAAIVAELGEGSHGSAADVEAAKADTQVVDGGSSPYPGLPWNWPSHVSRAQKNLGNSMKL